MSIKIKFAKPPSKNSRVKAAAAYKKLIARKDLGFTQLASRDDVWSASLAAALKLRSRGERLTVLGLGGSALGGRCLVDFEKDSNHAYEVDFISDTDPNAVARVLQNEKSLSENQFVVISKSGNTLEIACLLNILVPQLKKLGRKLSESILVITEKKPSPLYNWAFKEKIEIVEHPLDVGGRFSAFTPVGLIPFAFSTFFSEDRLSQLRQGLEQALKDKKNVIELAAFYFERFKRKEAVSAFWAYHYKLNGFLPWLEQLWAESLAKKNGPQVSTPVIYSGTCDQHSVLQQLMEGAGEKSICFFRDELTRVGEPYFSENNVLPEFDYLNKKYLGEVYLEQSRSTEEALTKVGRSTLRIECQFWGLREAGQLMMTFELLIGTLGELLKIDAFNQPGVELGKKITIQKLSKKDNLKAQKKKIS